MKKILFWPYQVYVWLILLPLVICLTLLFSMLTVIFANLVNPDFASRVFAVTWARLAAWKLESKRAPVVFEVPAVEGGEHTKGSSRFVVASNHQSMYDILVVYGWLRLDLKWVMKKELRKFPGIGIGCEKAGHIFIERRNPKQASQAITDAVSRMGDGVGILFFPEGTRSLDGRLLPFKKGAFRTAIEQQLPLLPVTLVGTRDIVPAKSLRLFPGSVRMVIHPPIETAGMTIDQLEALMERTRQTIASALPPELQ